jgi:predicted phosphodiesterase
VRVAALYDIHGNLPALRAVLEDAWRAGADQLVIGGDVAAGPMPRETLDQLMALADRARFVSGNADREVVEAFDRDQRDPAVADGPAERSAAFAASRITENHRDFLAGFSPTVALKIPGLGGVLFCHGSPRSDEEIITSRTNDSRLRGVLANVPERTVVCGHTHRQFDRTVDEWRVVNAGSVGMPYEGSAGAYWALIGPDVKLRRTDYDVEAAVASLRGSGYPDVDEMLRETMLDPVDPDMVAELFENQARAKR